MFLCFDVSLCSPVICIKARGMSWQDGEEFNSRQETIKCVVVGDTAVGKTRLICARACNASLHLSQMLTIHVPTVWAIDQYRIHKDVLRRSWMTVDGVNVSLRLWDTFGDHEKDRKFAYGRSDVVMLCFSISSHQSLRHCKTKWYPEIRQYCPQAPIVVVGCKNDLRHIHRDHSFVSLCNERNRSCIKVVKENELITRAEGRQLANEIGAVYYESSVYTQYGVDTVFENALRLALIARRNQRFWIKNLKNVKPPILQMPYCPPKPKEPEDVVLPSTFETEMNSLRDKGFETDVTFIVGGMQFQAHKIILSASSTYFKQLFISLSNEEKVILTFFQNMSPMSFRNFLSFVYCEKSSEFPNTVVQEMSQIINFASMEDLQELVDCIQKNNSESAEAIQKKYREYFFPNLQRICLKEKLFTDVTFVVDDGKCYAHRLILMARCDVMAAMFRGDFKESSEKIVPFPGVTQSSFYVCLHYLYTDSIDDSVCVQNCSAIIELANRLCLRRLITLIERKVIQELRTMVAEDIEEHIFCLLEICQVHNADQLFEWCQYYIITNYNEISTNNPKALRSLHQDYQAFLNKNRWPPLHYLKEKEYYERCIREREQKEKPLKYPIWKTAKKRISRCLRLLDKNKIFRNTETKDIVIQALANN